MLFFVESRTEQRPARLVGLSVSRVYPFRKKSIERAMCGYITSSLMMKGTTFR